MPRSGDVQGIGRAAKQLMDQGLFEAALAEVEAGLEQSPSRPGLLILGIDARSALGDHEGALECARTLMREHPDRSEGYARAGLELLALGRPVEALEAAAAGLAVNPERPSLLVVASDSCRALGDRAGSLAFAERLVSLRPDRLDGHVRLAQDLLALQRAEDARAAVEVALVAFPERPGLLVIGSDASRALADREGSLSFALRLVEHHPERPEGYSRAIKDLISLGRPDEARALIDDAVLRSPDQAYLLLVGISVCRWQGDREGSLDYAMRLRALHPDRHEGYVRIVHDLVALQRAKEARAVLQDGLERLPDQEHVVVAAAFLGRVEKAEAVVREHVDRLHGDDFRDWAPMRGVQHLVAFESEADASADIRRAYSQLLERRGVTGGFDDPWPSRSRGAGQGTRQASGLGLTFVTRLSILDPGFGGFKLLRTSDSFSEYERFLFSEERLAFKFDVFENVTIPSMRAQSDQEFSWIVFAGEQLPADYRDRLVAWQSAIPQLEVEFTSSMASVYSLRFEDGEASARLDDDDALSPDFVARVRAHAGRPGTMLSFPWGRRYEWVDGAVRMSPRGYFIPNNAQGLTAFGMNVYGCGRHTVVHNFFDVAYDCSPDMYLVCCSEFCDTNRGFLHDLVDEDGASRESEDG